LKPDREVYEWMPGKFFVLHTAYGRIGDLEVGGTQIIGYDETSDTYRSHFFDSEGNVTTQELSEAGGVWTWQGETTRATSAFSCRRSSGRRRARRRGLVQFAQVRIRGHTVSAGASLPGLGRQAHSDLEHRPDSTMTKRVGCHRGLVGPETSAGITAS
jgi:hypothetical protein